MPTTSVRRETRCLDIEITAALRRRRAASRRLPAFDEHGHRDDLDLLAEAVRDIVPWQKFGLSEEQRRRHANELVELWGWTRSEAAQVLDVAPRTGEAA